MVRYSDVNIWNKFRRSFPSMSKDAVKFTVDNQFTSTIYLKNGNGVVYNFITNRIESRFIWGNSMPDFSNELEYRNYILLAVRSAMVIKDRTQAELSDSIGMTRQQMNRYINGISPIPAYILVKIAKSLKILFSDLVNV